MPGIETESVTKSIKPHLKPNKTQGVLNVGQVSTTCKVCGMTYGHHPDDRSAHAKYHTNFINGPPWPFLAEPIRKISVARGSPPQKKAGKAKPHLVQLQFFVAQTALPAQVSRVETLLEMVNRELNAPAASEAWKHPKSHEIPGKALVAVVNKKAVALCITEPIESAFWVVSRTQQVVPKQEIKNARVGISRIWVAPSWRRCGVAMQLLDVVLHHSVYGMKLEKLQVAFSQPSFAGGLLAKRFNGVKHKSGETLVPVYLED